MSLMSYTSHFLHLPDDVLAYLLDFTPMNDLESVSKTCNQLRVICGVVRAPYLHELKLEGLEYNAASASPTVSFPQALASLRCRENRWRTMRPIMSSCRATLNDTDFTSYYQKVALYVSSQVVSTVVHGDTSERATYHGQAGEVTRLHAADVPQDLLVLLRTHIGTNMSYLSFLSLREMSPHSAAASPTRVLITSMSLIGYFATPLDARGLRILGPWCAILTTEPHSNVLLLCNWKTGALCKLAGIHSDKVDDFNFMNDRTLAVIHRASNPSHLILRLYDVIFPSQLCSFGLVTLRLSLQLPRIEAHVFISPSRLMLPRALQEQVLQPHQRPCEVFPPNSGIMALSTPLATGGEKARLDIAIDVSMLLSIIHGDNAADCALPWSEWGPKVSRVFLINEALRATGDVEPLQDVEGYRVAYSTNVDVQDTCIGISEEHSRPAAFVLDFSPASVRWARGEDKARRGMRGALVTEANVLRPGRLLAEEVVSSLPYTRTILAGYLPQHQIRLLRDEVVFPVGSFMLIFLFEWLTRPFSF
ncbi:hypothetical protein DEU56DRAFT_554560 [Suillus clintonianus]|uniref:uncharacterized protein n=1 Tax=Suillus clintonianus TaxID=1904413 RepID=UPI001B87B5AD|nr:uncharacterized protein DEU56DRAFT_554560 [Suillus clintonianus]KAG2151514.1 hypothetical protein DEU56DRAFT_554560 [Suillus clintonianus]